MMDDGRTPYLFRQLFYPLRWLIYVFNSVVNTKLPSITPVNDDKLEGIPIVKNDNNAEVAMVAVKECLSTLQ